MEDKYAGLLSSCARIDFGATRLPEGEKEFCGEFNNEILWLCESLPESTRTDATLFFIKYMKTALGPQLDFFRFFYPPAWSILYWLVQFDGEAGKLDAADIKNAKTAHSMAMLLHALDDHLKDNEAPTTHLTLLLRSQAWMTMNRALKKLAGGVDGGWRIVQDLIDEYYAAIRGTEEVDSLDRYGALFRKQMATWLIVPSLMSRKIAANGELSRAVQTAYGSFGIAWRLLDDINDIETDLLKGVHSSIYICLSDRVKPLWSRMEGGVEDNKRAAFAIFDHIMENGIIDSIKERTRRELASAATIADDANLPGLAHEFRTMSRPLENRRPRL